MAVANAQSAIVVNDFTLAGIDTTQRKTIVEGPFLAYVPSGAVATIAIAVAGTGWATSDTFSLAHAPGFIGKVTAQSGGVPSAIAIVQAGAGATATTGDVATAITAGSTGAGLTVTTTIVTAATSGIVAITGWSITSNACTFTTLPNSLTTGGGQSFTVQGFTGANFFLNGNYTTTSATSTTVVVPLTAANGSGVQSAIGVVQPGYITGGITLQANFIDQTGNPRPVGTLGPLSKTVWIDIKTIAASAYTYLVNTTGTVNLVKILNAGTELSSGTVIPADTVQVRAEFVKNSF